MNELSVGKEILAHCNKCKLTLAHMVVAMKGPTEIDKVMCKTCKATHTFKDPSAKKAKPAVSKIVRSAKGSSSRKVSEPNSVIWERMINKATAAAVDYSIRTEFKSGDVINHPTFGQGIVERSIDSNKIEVLFRDDSKVLLHNKK